MSGVWDRWRRDWTSKTPKGSQGERGGTPILTRRSRGANAKSARPVRLLCSLQRATRWPDYDLFLDAPPIRPIAMLPSSQSAVRRRPRRGFTLIEVLMVVTTLAIIAGVVVPQVSTVIDEAKNSAMLRDLREFTMAIERYRM